MKQEGNAAKLDYKKAYPDLYLPGKAPALVDVPPMPFFMLAGSGAPEDAQYQNAVSALYAVSYTIKMSKMGKAQPEGYFEYSVPPLEGLWGGAANGQPGGRKAWKWISMIRQPEFVTPELAGWAQGEAARKNPELDFSALQFSYYHEGLCVQAMHHGPYADEPATLAKMAAFCHEEGLAEAIGVRDENGIARWHHEIYLGDPRRTAPEKLRTVLRCPVARG